MKKYLTKKNTDFQLHSFIVFNFFFLLQLYTNFSMGVVLKEILKTQMFNVQSD